MSGDQLISVVGPALVAGLMISLSHAPLGIKVLERGIIFIDLAVAQIAGLGWVASKTLLHAPPAWLVQVVALACALLAGLFFRRMETAMPEQQEALIGCSFILAASLSILLLADHPQGSEEIRYLLSGQILFVTWVEVAKHAPVYISILAIWFLMTGMRRGLGFYLLFACAITSSVQLVGVYVVFASLILPALAALNSRQKYLVAWSCGMVSVIAGILVSILADLPAGPVIVVGYILSAYLCFIMRKLWGGRLGSVSRSGL